MEDIVADSIAMDKAWLAGTLDDWLTTKRKQVIDDLRTTTGTEKGNMEREATETLDADPVGP